MERLTQRNGVHVEYLKDGEAFPYTLMSGYDIQRVLECLAELEDALEQGELEPVRHGKWEKARYSWRCTACEMTVETESSIYEPDFDFCPNCGAKMDGD